MDKYLRREKIILFFLIIIFYKSYDAINFCFVSIANYVLPAHITEDVYLIDAFSTLFMILVFGLVYKKYLYQKLSINEEKGYFIWNKDKKNIISTCLGIIIIPLGMGGITTLWYILIDTYGKHMGIIGESYEKMTKIMQEVDNYSFIGTLFSVAIFGPIVEELVFRGILIGLLDKFTNNMWVSIIVSSIAFGVWHGILAQAVYAAAVGIIFGIVYYKTRNIYICFIMHIINNISSITFPFKIPEDIEYGYNIMQLVMVIPVLIISYYLVKKNYNNLDMKTKI